MRSILMGTLLLLFFGCATKEPSVVQSKFIVFKTPLFRYADMGFISQYDESMGVQIYANGRSVAKLSITKKSICMSLFECMDKEAFYKKVFQKEYPQSLLEDIFAGHVIFDGKNMVKNNNGFTQEVYEAGKYDIHYSNINKNIEFKDTIGNIVIKVQDR